MKRVLLAAVCGLMLLAPSMSKAYSWPGYKWPQGNPTVVQATIGSSIPSAWVYYFGYAMGTWNGAGAKFQFQVATGSRNTINLKTMWNQNGSLAVTYIHEYPFSKTTSERDTDFNAIYSWDINGVSNKYDAWSTVTHELGHWLTLGDLYNSSDYYNTMYGRSAPGLTYQRTLEPDDKAGIQRIYGVR